MPSLRVQSSTELYVVVELSRVLIHCTAFRPPLIDGLANNNFRVILPITQSRKRLLIYRVIISSLALLGAFVEQYLVPQLSRLVPLRTILFFRILRLYLQLYHHLETLIVVGRSC